MGIEYPKREPFFAMKYVRMLYKVCAAQTIGTLGVNLLTCIATTEDAARYRGGVTFFNGQLMPLLGITQWDTLNLARQKCIDGGFLHYESSGKRTPGLYWVETPDRYLNVDDSPMDEGTPTYADGYKLGWIDGYNACAKKHEIDIIPEEPYRLFRDKATYKARIKLPIKLGQSSDKATYPPILTLEEPSIEDSSFPDPTPAPNPENPKQEDASASCAEPPEAADSALADSPVSGVLRPLELSGFSFPVKGKGGKTWTLPQVKLDEYHESFPDLDVEAELRKARQWCRDHAAKQKTAKGMPAFLTRWLGNAQNRGGQRLLNGRGSVDDPRGNFAAYETYMGKFGAAFDDTTE